MFATNYKVSGSTDDDDNDGDGDGYHPWRRPWVPAIRCVVMLIPKTTTAGPALQSHGHRGIETGAEGPSNWPVTQLSKAGLTPEPGPAEAHASPTWPSCQRN